MVIVRKYQEPKNEAIFTSHDVISPKNTGRKYINLKKFNI